jgi:hydroxylamine reductase (hybrid-cluster protein)
MFCNQCEQTAKGEGCTKVGVCGKEADVAALQDLLIYSLKGLSLVAVEGRKVGVTEWEVNIFTVEAIFSTLTNVNFDPARFVQMIRRCVKEKKTLTGTFTYDVLGLADVVVVDVQCEMQSLAQVAKCYHTKLITTSAKAKIQESNAEGSLSISQPPVASFSLFSSPRLALAAAQACCRNWAGEAGGESNPNSSAQLWL